MFLDGKYVLANELVKKLKLNISNISILRRQFEDEGDETTVIKMNNCNFIKSNSPKLPKNIKSGIEKYEFTDFSDKLPLTWVRDEFGVNEEDLFNSGIVIDKIEVCNKKFYVFNKEFIEKVKNMVPYVLNKTETETCYQKGQIEGYIQLSNNKYMTWYNPRDY